MRPLASPAPVSPHAASCISGPRISSCGPLHLGPPHSLLRSPLHCGLLHPDCGPRPTRAARSRAAPAAPRIRRDGSRHGATPGRPPPSPRVGAALWRGSREERTACRTAPAPVRPRAGRCGMPRGRRVGGSAGSARGMTGRGARPEGPAAVDRGCQGTAGTLTAGAPRQPGCARPVSAHRVPRDRCGGPAVGSRKGGARAIRSTGKGAGTRVRSPLQPFPPARPTDRSSFGGG